MPILVKQFSGVKSGHPHISDNLVGSWAHCGINFLRNAKGMGKEVSMSLLARVITWGLIRWRRMRRNAPIP